jgi:hypothetical protein
VVSHFYFYYTIYLLFVNTFLANYIIFAIIAFVVIPCSSNIFSCSVSMLFSHIGSLCKFSVCFIILKPVPSKHLIVALYKLSSSVLKYISPPGFKNVLYFSNCFVCVSLFLLCLGFGHGLQKFIYILSTVSFSFNMFCIISISYAVRSTLSISFCAFKYSFSIFLFAKPKTSLFISIAK